MTDVLQFLYNPRTPEAAKQRTLRRLDGLEGRHAPVPNRHYLDHHDRGHENERASLSLDAETKSRRSFNVGADPSSSCRLSITEGVAPLASADSERRLSPPPMNFPPGGRRRVLFIDEWEIAGSEHDTSVPSETQSSW
ncbi:hypothetical protein ACEPAF_7369 [Sanghuangporus sanghuang]